MDRVLYLVHAMDRDFDNSWTELKTSGITDTNYQFPGVYFSLITKDNINRETLYAYKTILIFSKKLLEQQNYHININDYNGFINEKNTYFPWDLDKAIRKIKTKKRNIGNEVVFHDPIPMKYLCAVIIKKSIDPNIKDKYKCKLSSLLLPPYELYNNEPPDMSKLPFYCYPFEDNYTAKKFKLSSKKFYQKMATLCNVDNKQSREKIIRDITANLDDLYNHREKQKLEKFKQLLLNKI